MGAVLMGLGRLLAWLVGGSIAQWAAKALLGIGIGFAVKKFALPALMAFIKSHTSGMSQFLFDTFGAVGGDVAMTMIISAYVAAVSGNVAIKALKK
jgi:hypothetical protein